MIIILRAIMEKVDSMQERMYNVRRKMEAQRRKWQPSPVFLPGKSHGQRSLVGYSLWDHKESDTTEQVTHNIC